MLQYNTTKNKRFQKGLMRMNIFLGLQKKVKSDEKKKLSIDFELGNYKIMSAFASKYRLTNSGVINYLIEHFLQLTPDAKKDFAKVAAAHLASSKNVFSECDDFEREAVAKQISIYEDLILFFTDGKGLPKENYMKKIEINGGYVIFPNDWVVVDEASAKNCKYVGVVEVRNGIKYKCPHFVLFSEIPIVEFDNNIQDIFLDRCEIAYPDFRRIRAMQVKPVYDENNHMLNAQLWEQAPTIGVFEIPVYGQDTSFPAGAMIIKNSNF